MSSKENNKSALLPPLESSNVVVWVAVSILLITVLFLTAAPFADLLLGPSEFALPGAAHGILATVGMIVGTATVYLGWRLFIGEKRTFGDLRILAAVSSVLAAVTIVTGNWIYIAYRGPGGPREYFKSVIPEVHEIFFEFKEFIALFTLPIAVATTYVLWSYRETLLADTRLRTGVGIMIATAWAALMITFVLGASITKLMSV